MAIQHERTGKRKINKPNTQIYRNLKRLIGGPLNGPLKYNLEESDVQTQLCKGKKKVNKLQSVLRKRAILL